MDDVYLGVLPESDPLHAFLSHLLGLRSPVFESYRMHPQMLLVRYRDRSSGTEVACKFFGRKMPTEGEKPDSAHFRKIMQREESALEEMRLLGFGLPPYRVVRALGRNEELEFLLVEEFVEGPHLDHFLRGAYKQMGDRLPLQECLRQLGGFLGELHRRSARDTVAPASFQQPVRKYLGHLREREVEVAADLLVRLETAVAHDKNWTGVSASLLHGDCTPINFIFPGENEMVAIDLERSHRSDPMRDLGALEAELRLAAIAMADDLSACQDEIKVLREAYGPLDEERLNFWVGTALVRISRNDWHKQGQRPQILEEALRCLSR